MDKEKVRMIVRNMELLVRALKEELEEYPLGLESEELITPVDEDFDEVY